MSTKTKEISILIIDDDNHFRETLTDAMSLKKFKVESATSGADALKVLEKKTPALILLDVQLPDIHGFDRAASGVCMIQPILRGDADIDGAVAYIAEHRQGFGGVAADNPFDLATYGL